MKKRAVYYLTAAVGCALFSAIYESFSHGVYSPSMIFMGGWPFLGGALPCLALSRWKGADSCDGAARIYAMGILTLTVGSGMKGIFEIYGTTSEYLAIYPIAGGILLLGGAGKFGWQAYKEKIQHNA